MEEIETPWFEKGLSFRCTGCGKCCTGSDGYVFLSPVDIQNLASHLHMSQEDFCRRYTRLVDGDYALLDQRNGDCIFLKKNQCDVYQERPVQCRTFPFWTQNLRSKSDWEKAASFCEGINHPDAPTVPLEEIEHAHATYLENLLEQNFSSS